MTTRPKLELNVNDPKEIELLFDDPICGESRYGPYSMYAVKVDGIEYSFFSPSEIDEQLKQLQKGDKVTITKLAAKRNNKLITTYAVEKETNGKQYSSGKVEANARAEENPEKSLEQSDRYYEIMLHSYRDAIRIQEELNGLTDVSRIAITLFIARSKLPFNGNGN